MCALINVVYVNRCIDTHDEYLHTQTEMDKLWGGFEADPFNPLSTFCSAVYVWRGQFMWFQFTARLIKHPVKLMFLRFYFFEELKQTSATFMLSVERWLNEPEFGPESLF